MITSTTPKKNRPKKSTSVAYKQLLLMIREFELMYNLSPVIDEVDKQYLLKEIEKILV